MTDYCDVCRSTEENHPDPCPLGGHIPSGDVDLNDLDELYDTIQDLANYYEAHDAPEYRWKSAVLRTLWLIAHRVNK